VIEVNLLPGARKRAAPRKGRRSLSLPKVGGIPSDPWRLGAGALVVLALLVVGWLYMGVAGEAEELQVQIEAAQRDSARFADVIERAGALQARRDSIAARVSVIQGIDGARFVWSHLMDEVGRALPDYTWLTRLQQVGSSGPMFRVQGQAATYFALGNFMETLEASPFVRGVRLIASEQVAIAMGGGAQRLIYNFTLEASYQAPPPEIVERVPLFGPSVAIPAADGGI
jgi:Tfp pilus assembly protein PilN